jgi:YbbR domain-containing protein
MNLRKFTNRLPLMAASLSMAVFLWMIVIAEEKIDAGFTVPLVFDNVPSSVVIDGTPADSVYVQIRGSKQAVANALPQQIRAHVNLSHVKPGNEFIQIGANDIIIPAGLAVRGVYPPYLDLKFLARKPVTVRVRTEGKPAEGYLMKSVAAIPRQVEIVGPLPRLEAISEVETFPVNVDGLKKRMKVRAELVQPGDDIRLLLLKPTEVVVEIEVRTLERKLRKVPVAKVEGQPAFSPSAVTVVVQGGYHQVKALTREEITVNVMWEAGGESPVRALAVTAPEGIEVLSYKPEEVKVR